MIPHHVYYQLAILGLLWLCVILHYSLAKPAVLSPQATGRTRAPTGKRKRCQRTQTL